jgi:hypothetical protein
MASLILFSLVDGKRGISLLLLNNKLSEDCTSSTDHKILTKQLTSQDWPIHHSQAVKIFKSDKNCVQVPDRPFHEVSSAPTQFRCSTCFILKPNNRQSLFELHWQNHQIEPTKSLKCWALSRSNHIRTLQQHTRSEENFIFEFCSFRFISKDFS